MNSTHILQDLQNGKLKHRELEKLLPAKQAAKLRADFVAQSTGQDLQKLAVLQLDPEQLINNNIENLLGSIEIPVGVAGPLKVSGQYAQGDYYIPLATTEGALVASVNRGCKLVSMAGGVTTRLEYIGITRAPLLKLQNHSQMRQVTSWIEQKFVLIQQIAAQTSSHLKLLKIQPFSQNLCLWLRMHFDTDQAMGMNMATKASGEVVKAILDQFPKIRLIAISGNLCVDKKACKLNMTLGRGRKVTGSIVLPAKLIVKQLSTTVEQMLEVNKLKTWQASDLAGSIAHNAHAANMIAAIFAATGQDLAHIVDSSLVDTKFELTKQGDLRCEVSLPSLIVGTVGGGTNLPKQNQAIKLMLADLNQKNSATNNTHKFAEIIAAVVLAGEISLHAAIANNTLISAHQSLGKGKSQI